MKTIFSVQCVEMATSNIHKNRNDKKLQYEIKILDKPFFLLTARSSCCTQSLSPENLAADSLVHVFTQQ